MPENLIDGLASAKWSPFKWMTEFADALDAAWDPNDPLLAGRRRSVPRSTSLDVNEPPEISTAANQQVIPQEEIEELRTTAPDPEDIELAVRSEPIEDEDGNLVVVAQQNMGVEGSIGGGEFPSKDTPPRGPAPG